MPNDSERLLKTLGATIRSKREAAGLSVSEAARRTELHRLHWHQIEIGKRIPTVRTLCAIADTIGILPGDLLNLADKRKRRA
jgi:transcriptional regulator with XRE-family HTH domain